MPGRAGLPGQSPHAPWAAVDKGLGRLARDALAVSDDDALQEGLGLAVAAIDVDLEQVLEDPTVVRDDLGSVECQGIVVTLGTVLEDEDLGVFEGDELVLLCPRVQPGSALSAQPSFQRHPQLDRTPPAAATADLDAATRSAAGATGRAAVGKRAATAPAPTGVTVTTNRRSMAGVRGHHHHQHMR